MTTEDLYVIAYEYNKKPNTTSHRLVNNKVYKSKEEAEKEITNKEIMIAINLREWADECEGYGGICAYA